jgi:glycosyltransferase involved in cell wall biosynthesis
MDASIGIEQSALAATGNTAGRRLAGRRAAMCTFSSYPGDPRPRRAVEALLAEGMAVDMVCLADGKAPAREQAGGLTVYRIPITHTRGGKVRYGINYALFLYICAVLMTARMLRGRFHLVYVHNMPDVLVFSALIPKLFGAKVILDQHDPMPELMTTIYGLSPESPSVRVLRWLERLSLRFADRVVTVNVACRRIFGGRSCPPEKITVVMNSPDEGIFPYQVASPSTAEPGRPFVVMYHGSLVERNGLDLAVEALALVQNNAPDMELRVFGRETPYLRQVMERAKTLGLEGRVRFLGPRRLEELPGEITACDIGVIPNQRNAFTDINTPTRIFEYLSVGKTAIAPRTPGILDYFAEDSLVFFEAGDCADLAYRLLYAYQKREVLTEIARRGQQVLLEHTWRRERETLLQAVSGLLDRPAAA